MKKIKFMIITLFMILLSGCFNDSIYTKQEKYSKEAFLNSNKGVVFFDLLERDGKTTFPIRYELIKFDSVEMIRYDIIAYLDLWSMNNIVYERDCSKQFLFLEPGIYFIDHVSLLQQGNYRRWLGSPGYKDNYFKYGAFELKSGEVINLGKVIIDENINFYKEDNTDEVKERLLEAGIQELAEKLKKGEFYVPGSILFKDKNGNNKIISYEEIEDYRRELAKSFIEHKNNMDSVNSKSS